MEVQTNIILPINTDNIIVAGLDPSSYRNCGWCIVRLHSNNLELLYKSTHELTLSQDDISGNKLKQIYDKFQEIIDTYHPNVLSVERSMGGGMSFVRNNLSETVGVAKMCCFNNSIQVAEVSPAHVKKEIAGHGRATKKYIKLNIKETFGLKKPGPEHECDAAAFAICFLIDSGWKGYNIKVPYLSVSK